MGCGGPMPGTGRIDRRYCRPGCRTLAYRMRLRTRGIEHGPTAVPRWAVGRLPELAVTLTTLGRVQGNVTTLARQLECEEAAVRAELLRLRALGDPIEETEPPEPQERLRAEAEALRKSLDEALAQRNTTEEELRKQQARFAGDLVVLRRELEVTKKARDQLAERLTAVEKENAALKAGDLAAGRRATEMQAQARGQAKAFADEEASHQAARDALSRTRVELLAAQENFKALQSQLLAAKQELARARASAQRLQVDLSAARRAEEHRATALQRQTVPTLAPPSASRALPPPRAAVAQPAQLSLMTEEPGHGASWQASPGDELQEQLDRRAEEIARLFCSSLLQAAAQRGEAARIQTWLERYDGFIRAAASMLIRSALVEKLRQTKRTTMNRAAESVYARATNAAASQSGRLSSGFLEWMGNTKDFLVTLARAAIVELKAKRVTRRRKTTTKTRTARAPRRRERQTDQQSEWTDLPTAEPKQESAATQVPPSVPIAAWPDPLADLMRDKVQLLHMLAEYQEERGLEVTGRSLISFDEAHIAAAALIAAREARRAYYFRPRGILGALVDWQVENVLLDARSEKELFGEVMDEIDQLKIAVDKLKPKRGW